MWDAVVPEVVGAQCLHKLKSWKNYPLIVIKYETATSAPGYPQRVEEHPEAAVL